jgi:hypothetical protein
MLECESSESKKIRNNIKSPVNIVNNEVIEEESKQYEEESLGQSNQN